MSRHDRLPHAPLQGGPSFLEGELPDGGGAGAHDAHVPPRLLPRALRPRAGFPRRAVPPVPDPRPRDDGDAAELVRQQLLVAHPVEDHGNIVFILLPPLSPADIFAAYLGASIVRGLVVGLGVFVATAWIVPVPVLHPLWAIAFALVGSALLGTLGIIAGIWAEKFD